MVTTTSYPPSDENAFIRSPDHIQTETAMSQQAVIGKRFTIVVPKALRKKLDLREGQTILMRIQDGRLILEPLPHEPYKVLEQVIREPYVEARDEKRSEDWLKRHARR